MKKLFTLCFLLLFINVQAKTNTLPVSHFSDKTAYQVCFTPGRQCTSLLIHYINQAKQSIYMQAYAFTSYRIAKALVHAYEKGVKVFVIVDKSQLKKENKSRLGYLTEHHVPAWEDKQVNIAHNKVMIFDQRTVETGSFNYTYSAQHFNAENMLFIQDQKLAKLYLANWLRRKKVSTRLDSVVTR